MKRLIGLLMLATFAVACNPTPVPNSQVAIALGPMTWIDAPLDGFTLPLKPYDIVSHATFSNGVTAFELSVNGQRVRADNVPPNQAGQTLAQISQSWTPPAPGTYLLAVRAASAAGGFGAPAQVRVTVGDGNLPAPNAPASSSASTSSQSSSAGSRAPVSSSSSSSAVTRPATTTATPNRPAESSSSSSAQSRPAVSNSSSSVQSRPVPSATFTLPPPPPLRLPTATNTPVPRDTQGPPAPTQTAPVNGVSVQCGTVVLTWRPPADSSGIRDYDVEIQHAAGNLYVAEKSWDAATTSAIPFVPSCSVIYRWRVRATDRAGNEGNWSGYETFRVDPAVPR